MKIKNLDFMRNIGDAPEIFLFGLPGFYMRLTKTPPAFPNNIIATANWLRKTGEAK
jgi:hypothetical protein